MDDYAFYISALIELYNSTLDENYISRAELFCKETIRKFMDVENGGFYLSDPNSTELFINPKETYDGATPSGNSVMAYNLTRLYGITEKEEYKEILEKQMAFMSESAYGYPSSSSMFLIAKIMYEDSIPHVTIVPKDASDLNKLKGKLPFLANVSVVPESAVYPLVNNKTTFYVCKNRNCLPPSNELNI